jgi:hypothetical protein
MILFMIPLFLMLLLWQQNCRLLHGPHHTSHPSFPCMMGTQIQSSFDELRSNYIFVRGQYRSHGEVLRHGHLECSPNMVFFSSARDYHVMAEAQGYVGYQFPRLSNEASHSSGSVPVHARP